jgi:dihydroorotate dehydrogenase electron transfer subunit
VNVFRGSITEIELAQDGQRRAVIACPEEAIPAPGQYIQAHISGDEDSVVPISLFLGGWVERDESQKSTFTTAPPIPPKWQPGDKLTLRGPLGKGFNLLRTAKRVSLVPLGETTARLLPLVRLALQQNAEVAIFTDAPLPRLPTQVEANPLRALPEALSWAHFLAFDGAPEDFRDIGETLGVSPQTPLPCQAQVLIDLPMPCGGLADCGVCAVVGKGRKQILVCVDGPVFPWTGELWMMNR